VSSLAGGHRWRRAERDAAVEQRPLGVLLLPERLERFSGQERARDLLTAPGVVAIDPARVSYRALGRLPAAVMDGVTVNQARRMKLPGTPRALLLFHPLQYPLARALAARHGSQLWYADWAPEPDAPRRQARRLADLDAMAAARAGFRFDATAGDAPARERNRVLWERLERLGVESGRLGSERADVIRAWPGGDAA
jgi:hypothetical protein